MTVTTTIKLTEDDLRYAVAKYVSEQKPGTIIDPAKVVIFVAIHDTDEPAPEDPNDDESTLLTTDHFVFLGRVEVDDDTGKA